MGFILAGVAGNAEYVQSCLLLTIKTPHVLHDGVFCCVALYQISTLS